MYGFWWILTSTVEFWLNSAVSQCEKYQPNTHKDTGQVINQSIDFTWTKKRIKKSFILIVRLHVKPTDDVLVKQRKQRGKRQLNKNQTLEGAN